METYRPDNPFPIATRDRLLKLARTINEIDPTSADVDLICAALEMSELCKWLIAHAHQEETGPVVLRIILENPARRPIEQFFYETMRANPL